MKKILGHWVKSIFASFPTLKNVDPIDKSFE